MYSTYHDPKVAHPGLAPWMKTFWLFTWMTPQPSRSSIALFISLGTEIPCAWNLIVPLPAMHTVTIALDHSESAESPFQLLPFGPR
jgi:hypothetical protein